MRRHCQPDVAERRTGAAAASAQQIAPESRLKPAVAPSALKIQAVLGDRFTVLEFDASTRTSEEAAAAIGCAVEQIAKSLVFRSASGKPVLVIASGVNRVDEKKAAALVGEKISRADPEFVRESTGFAIGGVPPLGHDRELPTIVDESLRRFEYVWCAAGTPNAVFEVRLDDLLAALPAADVRTV